MRDKLSEQDLTDYALDALDPLERIYVESVLAVSEEARHDVTRTIEMARLLEQAYEREDVAAEVGELSLDSKQRAALVRPRFGRFGVFRQIAAGLVVIACVELGITSLKGRALFGARVVADKARAASAQIVSRVSVATEGANGADLAKALAAFWEVSNDNNPPSASVDPDALPEPTIICTPPPLVFDGSVLTGAR